MLAERPQVARLRPRLPSRLLELLLEIERLRSFPLLPGLETPQELADLVVPEPGQREVEIGIRLDPADSRLRAATRSRHVPGEDVVIVLK
jgi:hypothetical protein